MDIDELKQKACFYIFYPFLNKVLDAYNEYDKKLDKEPQLHTFYDSNVKHANGDEKVMYKDICIKLLRNLKLLKDKGYSHGNNQEYCTYLYHWLYKETKESEIPDMLISTIFDDFHKKMAHQEGQYICPYTSYKKEIYKPKNLAKLSYLIHNIEDIKSILNNNKGTHYCSCQTYLKDCVDLYRDMNAQLCTSERRKNNESICYELSQFQIHYSYITMERELEKIIPNIESGIRNEELSDCQTKDQTSVPVADSSANTDASTSNTSSAVISSMFTPVGKLFRFGNKNNTKITSNFDKEIENELFHVMQKDSNIKDIDSKYNIGYEPI
ncbi:hypothetical protein PVIIG_05448 [Plasmodium vivax India VII]|uniref:VIR protein n=1 Tax=Plasmodium vivax India VII TaxID=1077284 RepID=A0A0J9UUF0_PLAVI|nr:hypothetical protein PVIIG_05448 [Plasmodium vivax India VII]